jgi:hypothetical protein
MNSNIDFRALLKIPYRQKELVSVSPAKMRSTRRLRVKSAMTGMRKMEFLEVPFGKKSNSIKYILFFCFMMHLRAYSQDKKTREYIFFDKYNNADLKDINYESIYNASIDCHGLSLLDKVFNVMEGKYIVYRFLNHVKDSLFFPDTVILHDYWFLIILKTDNKNRIIDGYWHLLTNPELPNCFLYRISSQNVKLTHNLTIKKLQFKREPFIEEGEDEDICADFPLSLEEIFKEKGLLNCRSQHYKENKKQNSIRIKIVREHIKKE